MRLEARGEGGKEREGGIPQKGGGGGGRQASRRRRAGGRGQRFRKRGREGGSRTKSRFFDLRCLFLLLALIKLELELGRSRARQVCCLDWEGVRGAAALLVVDSFEALTR